MVTPSDGLHFAPFLRRLSALVMDCVIIALLLAAVSTVAEGTAYALGARGRLVGALVTLVYFAYGNSAKAHGQTLAKRLLQIRVVGPDGNCLSMGPSLLRSALLVVPLALNGAAIPGPVATNIFAGSLLSGIVFGVPLASVYLCAFTKPARRCIHDLAVRSSVVRDFETAGEWPRPKRVHLAVSGLLIAASLLTPLAAWRAVPESIDALLPLHARLSTMPDVWNVSVEASTRTMTISGRPSSTLRYLIVRARSKRPNPNFDELANNLARASLEHWPKGVEVDYLSVEPSAGIDLFLFQRTQRHNATYSPDEWRKRLGMPR